MGLLGVGHVRQFVRERPRVLVAAPLEIDSEGRVQFKQRLRITHSIELINCDIYTLLNPIEAIPTARPK